MVAALATTACFAVTAVFANRAAHRLGSVRANFARLLIAVVMLGAWAHLFGSGVGGGAARWFIASGLAGFGIGGLAMFQALPRLGSSLAMLIVQCGSAVVAATFEWAWLDTRLTGVQFACATATLTGVAIGMMPRSLPLASPRERAVGVAWAVLSAIGQGTGAVLSRKAFATAASLAERVDAGTAAYERALAGLAVAAVALVVVLIRSGDHPREPGRAWPWVAANALTGPVLGVAFFQWALSTTPAGIVQPVVATSPLATIPIAGWVEHRWPQPRYYAGAILAVAGVIGLIVFK